MTLIVPSTDPPPESWRYQPGQCIGEYRLIRPLGRGGAGEVFEAVHVRIGQRVALKVLRSEVPSPSETARLLNEARILARLHHPSIVSIHTCGELPTGDVFLVMEYVEGASLRSHLHRLGRPLSLAQGIAIVLQAAEALNYMHMHQVVHRDIKPENILLLTDLDTEDSYRIKIIDFGIAKAPPLAVEPDTQMNTPRAMLLGTPQYMAPEQGAGTDGASDKIDVYALALVLFELVTGGPPFVAESDLKLLTLHRKVTPPTLREQLPDAPPAIVNLVERMLNKSPVNRPSMLEVMRQLRILSSSSVGKRTELVRRRVFPTLSTVLGIMLLLSGGLFLRRERAQSEEHLQSFLDTAEETISNRDWMLAQRPGTATIRLQTLRQLADKLDHLRKPGASNWRIERLFVRCQYRLGDLALVYEPLANARQAYQAASAITTEFQGWAPDPDEARQLLATDLTKQGDLARQEGKQGAAKDFYAKAASIQEDLLRRHPNHPEYLRQLAISYDGRGDVLLEEGDEPGARLLYEQALAAVRQRAPRAPDESYQRYLEALVLSRLADAANTRGARWEAEELYLQSLALARLAVSAQPQSTLYRLLLAHLNERIGSLYIQLSRLPEAHRFLDQALTTAHALVDGDQANKRHGLILVQTLLTAGRLAEAEQDLPGSRKLAEAAHELLVLFAADLDSALWQRELLESLLHLVSLGKDAESARARLEQTESILRGFQHAGRWEKDVRVGDDWKKLREIFQLKSFL